MKIVIDIPKIFYDYCKAQSDATEIILSVKNGKPLDKIRSKIVEARTFEQRVHGETEFLKGIDYCLDVIDNYEVESENNK